MSSVLVVMDGFDIAGKPDGIGDDRGHHRQVNSFRSPLRALLLPGPLH